MLVYKQQRLGWAKTQLSDVKDLLKKLLLPVILLLLAYVLWSNADVKMILAGVAVFLFGMLGLEQGFKAFTGGILERVLQKATNTTWKSVGFGIVTTAIMQSSSLVSVITISFLSAGLITLTQGIGIIFGSNLGTTTGAWLVAAIGMKVNISAYAMPMLVFGAVLVFQRSASLKGLGYVLAGMGFLFLGIHYMKLGFESFKSTIDLTEFAMSGFAGLLVYTLIGAFATVVMQSSHATMVLTITALSAGQVTYENALALAIGANIGTTITAIIGAISANIEGRRLAVAHLIFNTVTAAIALVFLQFISQGVDAISAVVGIADDDYTMKLAVFHTVFNLIGVAVMIPLIDKLVAKLQIWLPDPERRSAVVAPPGIAEKRRTPEHAIYLNESALYSADTTLHVLIAEIRHLIEKGQAVAAYCLYFDLKALCSEQPIRALIKQTALSQYPNSFDLMYNLHIKALYSDIVAFTAHIDAQMTPQQNTLLLDLKSTAHDVIDALKDIKHLGKNMTLQLNGDHQYAIEEYNEIRYLIAKVIRGSAMIRDGQTDNPVLQIDKLQLFIKSWQTKFEQRFDSLIKHGHLSSGLASSLLNDYHYAMRISEGVTQRLKVVHGAEASGETTIASYLALNEDEIQEIANSASQHSEPTSGSEETKTP